MRLRALSELVLAVVLIYQGFTAQYSIMLVNIVCGTMGIGFLLMAAATFDKLNGYGRHNKHDDKDKT